MNRLEALQEMLQNDPKDSFIRYAVAKEYESLGDNANAITIFEKLKSDDQHYVGLYYHLGKLYENVNNHGMAMEVYNEGIRIARSIQDLHALSELNNARANLEIEE